MFCLDRSLTYFVTISTVSPVFDGGGGGGGGGHLPHDLLRTCV